jgi:hypothetical protein
MQLRCAQCCLQLAGTCPQTFSKAHAAFICYQAAILERKHTISNFGVDLSIF